jgi:hypothetical protein
VTRVASVCTGGPSGEAKAGAAAASEKDKKSVSIAPGTVNNEKPAGDKKTAAADAGANTTLQQTTEDDEFSSVTNCRMYESKYPEADDLVIVQVRCPPGPGPGLPLALSRTALSRRHRLR